MLYCSQSVVSKIRFLPGWPGITMGANLSSTSYSLLKRRANVGENLKIRNSEPDKVEICCWFDKLTMTQQSPCLPTVAKRRWERAEGQHDKNK